MQKEELTSLRIEKGVYPEKRRFKRPLLMIIPLLILGILTYIFLGSPPSLEITDVSLIYPSQSLLLLSASGYVTAEREASLGVKTTGTLEWLGVREGDMVRRGQVIGRLENNDKRVLLEQARANLELVLAALKEAETELYDAELAFKRNKELYEQGFLSQAEYEASLTRLKRTEAIVLQRKAQIRTAEAQIKEAEIALKYTYIRVPFDGVVLTKDADVGDIVTPLGAAANARASVITIADLNTLHVEVDVSEQYISNIREGQACEIELDAFPQKRFRGKVLKIIPTVDRTKATIKVKIAFVDKEKGILPDMSAKVSFLERELSSEELKPVVAVRGSSIGSNSKRYVFVVEGDRIKKREVLTGRSFGEFIEILQGLAGGERIVLKTSERLRDGMKIRIKEE